MFADYKTEHRIDVTFTCWRLLHLALWSVVGSGQKDCLLTTFLWKSGLVALSVSPVGWSGTSQHQTLRQCLARHSSPATTGAVVRFGVGYGARVFVSGMESKTCPIAQRWLDWIFL